MTPAQFQQAMNALGLEPGQELMVAASGGLDSMVLCHLLIQLDYRVHVAHMNYRLRGRESTGDERFVKTFALKHRLPFHCKRLSDAERDELKKGATQEKARAWRYRWLAALAGRHGKRQPLPVLTAHHLNDQAETMLFRFIRGSGIAGLAGMRARHEGVYRPLLQFSKSELEQYALSQKLRWRNDSSNQTQDYMRNRIRLTVLPAIEKINPAFNKVMSHHSVLYAETAELMAKALRREMEAHTKVSAGGVSIELQWLRNSAYPHLLLWHIMEPYGFSAAQVNEAMTLLHTQTGKHVDSTTHCLLRERQSLTIQPHPIRGIEVMIHSPADKVQFTGGRIVCRVVDAADAKFEPNAAHALLDAEALQWPLVLRPWQQGDVFRPLGMNGRKKLSDFITGLKLSGSARAQVHVLLSEGRICWVVGHRISEDFKLKPSTRRALLVQWLPH